MTTFPDVISILSSVLRNVDQYTGIFVRAGIFRKNVRRTLAREIRDQYHFSTTLTGILMRIAARQDMAEAMHILRVDPVRHLIGLVWLGATDPAHLAFLVDGERRFLRFSKSLPPPDIGCASTMHILWLPFGPQNTRLEVRHGAMPIAVYLGKRSIAETFSIPVATHDFRRSFLRKSLALLGRWLLPGGRFDGSWVLIDKYSAADDNAEHLYRWLKAEHPEQPAFFALSKQSTDWPRLKQEGFKLIDLDSLWFFLAWLRCAWIVSSSVADFAIRPNWRSWYADLVKHQYAYIRHGISKDFMSELNRHHVDLLLTSTRREYDSFVHDPRYAYVYSQRETELTGNARHDALFRKAAAVAVPVIVLIMPTWRKRLAGKRDMGTGLFPYSSKFTSSEFFRNWQAVLSSPALREAVRTAGLELHFSPHIYYRQQVDDFDTKGIAVHRGETSLQDLICNTALLITDYSSLGMEAALLRRSVLYFQFDRDSFWGSDHSYSRGYFDYDRDGFGDVACTPEDLVSKAIAVIRTGCVLEERFRRRADAFFAFSDQRHCERIYAAIQSRSVPEAVCA